MNTIRVRKTLQALKKFNEKMTVVKGRQVKVKQKVRQYGDRNRMDTLRREITS